MNVPGGCFIPASILLSSVGWITELPGTSQTFFLGITKSGSNVIAVGVNNFSASTTGDIIVVNFNDSNGNVNWQEKVNTVSSQYPSNVVIDSAGKIRFVSLAKVGSPYVLKPTSLNSDGSLNNAAIFNLSTWGSSQGPMDVDSSGNLYGGGRNNNLGALCKFDSTGSFIAAAQTNINFLNNYQVCVNGSSLAYAQDGSGSNLIVASITQNLTTINWKKQIAGSSGNDTNPRLIIADTSNNIYVISSTSGYVPHLHKFDSSGNWLWSVSFTLAGSNLILVGLATNSSGIAISGRNSTLGTGIVIQLDGNGNELWGSTITKALSAPDFNDIRAFGTNLYVAADIGSVSMVAIKLPFLTAPPNGTYGSWTIATSLIAINPITPTITTPTFTLSTPSTTGSPVTPTITTTSFSATTTSI